MAGLYCDHVRAQPNPLEVPLLIPEFRYGGLLVKHVYHLDFLVVNPYTFDRTGFELSPWSTHGYLYKTKELTQAQINAMAADNFAKEMKKHRSFFKKRGIMSLIFTDDDLKNDRCLQLRLQTRTYKKFSGWQSPTQQQKRAITLRLRRHTLVLRMRDERGDHGDFYETGYSLAGIVSSCFALATAQNPVSLKTPETAAIAAPCAKPAFPGHNRERISHVPLDEWSLPKLAAARQYADSLHDSSVMIVQCGRLVDEWGDPSKKITTFSVRKSLISALYGIYSAEGKIDVNETLEQAGIDDSPSPLTQAERQARIVDLLRARSGIYHAADFETDFQRKARPARESHAPGTFWFYNNWDFNALGTIFEKKTGVKIGDAFYQRIAKPIGMQDFKPGDLYYVGNGEVSQHPAYMFEMTARDMARFGLLYLNHGGWKGHQIIPEAWVEKSTHATEMVHLGHMNLGGYEYLWWVEYGGVHLAEATLPGMYSAQGAGGHFILVIPSLSLIIVNQYNNEPEGHDPKSVLQAAQDKHAVFDEQFAHLVKLILDARTPPST